jgi:hypothetical protein
MAEFRPHKFYPTSRVVVRAGCPDDARSVAKEGIVRIVRVTVKPPYFSYLVHPASPMPSSVMYEISPFRLNREVWCDESHLRPGNMESDNGAQELFRDALPVWVGSDVYWYPDRAAEPPRTRLWRVCELSVSPAVIFTPEFPHSTNIVCIMVDRNGTGELVSLAAVKAAPSAHLAQQVSWEPLVPYEWGGEIPPVRRARSG